MALAVCSVVASIGKQYGNTAVLVDAKLALQYHQEVSALSDSLRKNMYS